MSKSEYSVLDDIPSSLNQNLTSPAAPFYQGLLGEPRRDRLYSATPSEATNPALLNICKTDNVGPFRATGLKAAVDSLKEVMNEIARTYPELIGKLNNNGMFVVRYIKGTNTLSNHSWGGAIDLGVDGISDRQKDNKIQHGLALIAPIFNKHGWYSGAAYQPKKDKKTGKIKSNEDSMHFEVSKEKLLGWQKAGMFGPLSKIRKEAIAPVASRPTITSSTSHDRSMLDFLQKGDKGPNVVKLQNALKSQNYNISSDGRFGMNTEAALIDFQRKHGLTTNGIVGLKTALFLALY